MHTVFFFPLKVWAKKSSATFELTESPVRLCRKLKELRAVAENEGIDLGAYGDVLSFSRKDSSATHVVVNPDDEFGGLLHMSAVAMRTDGLPDGWALQLHAGTIDGGRGMCYRTLAIKNEGVSGSSAITRVR